MDSSSHQAKAKLESVYRNETDVKVKERLLLVLKAKNDGMIAARAAKQLHRSRTWASDWLRRYNEEGVDGLKDRLKSGRPSELSTEISLRIRRNLKESKRGWTTKQVNDMIVRESGKRYHYTHIYKILHKVGLQTQGT